MGRDEGDCRAPLEWTAEVGRVNNIRDAEEPSTCRRATADRCAADRG